MTTATSLGPSGGTARRLAAATWRASRSRWVWTPAAVGTAGVATATVALARLLTVPPSAIPKPSLWPLRMSLPRPGRVRLNGPAAGAPGRWGLDYATGRAEIGAPIAGTRATDEAERTYRVLDGEEPTDGAPARLDANVWPDRQVFSAATGIHGYDLDVTGETGVLPAWVFPAGDGRRWGILVHGRGAPRAQMLRLVPQLHARGITAMVISYRNDFAGCSDPTGRMHFGHREWTDLEAAALAAREHGAEGLVLGGMSMGGAIIATFLRRSALAAHVVGSILDAPALNWGPILRHVARSNRLPGWIVPGVMAAAQLHSRIDWTALNHAGSEDPLTAPVLLIHGDRDPVVPFELSEAYAEARPDHVTFLRVEGAGHVSAWNVATDVYCTAVDGFLARLAGVAESAALQTARI